MSLDFDQCHRAISSRDRRFDGRFFTGVTSTGIYCRPICPARTPRRDHCVFFEHAAQAAAAGFRPCRRCRPETAPGTPAWRGTSTTLSRALALIARGALDRGSVVELADRLGVGDRHLRRLFRRQLGVSPLQVAQTHRVHLGRQLLRDTGVPVAEVAASVGFASERRFRAAVQKAFRQSPTEIRRQAKKASSSDSTLELRLGYRPPYDVPATLAFLARRAVTEVERVDDDGYSRVLDLDGELAIAHVRFDEARSELALRLPPVASKHLLSIVNGVRRHFDLDADPSAIAECLGRDPRLRSRLAQGPLPRVLGGLDPFEMVVRAVIGQQVSVEAATTVTRRLVRRCGRRLRDAERLSFAFPTARSVATADLDGLGLTTARRETLHTIAVACLEHPEWLELGPDLQTRIEQWRSLPGIGDWTAQILAMRALRDPDAFPAGDLGVRKALGESGAVATEAVARRHAESWKPFRAYATALLWQDSNAAPAPTRRRS